MKLNECKSEAERRKYYPQLCAVADALSRTSDPNKVAKIALWIIHQRQIEKAQEEKAKADAESHQKYVQGL